MGIELPWPENPANTCMRHTEAMDSCFDPIRFHQQCIPWSPPQEHNSISYIRRPSISLNEIYGIFLMSIFTCSSLHFGWINSVINFNSRLFFACWLESKNLRLLRVRVSLGVMALKGYFMLSKIRASLSDVI